MRSLLPVLAALAVFTSGAHAQDFGGGGGTKAEAEQAVQAYLALWSRNSGINEASVERFYAPNVVYYGKSMSREAVLADKQAYIRQWPSRDYREVPDSLTATCNADRSLCKVSADMTWRRVSRGSDVSTGRARLTFDFVPAEGRRKIAKESARIL